MNEAAALREGDAEGIEAADVDQFDAVFGDGADLMNLDLPDDSAVSEREASDDCLEEGMCSRPGLTFSYSSNQLLGDMEDMLIARVKSYMQVRWTKGPQLCAIA